MVPLIHAHVIMFIYYCCVYCTLCIFAQLVNAGGGGSGGRGGGGGGVVPLRLLVISVMVTR